MRDIRFRAWDLKKKKMGVTFSLEDASYEGFPSPFTDANGECDIRAKYEVMQYTNLKDKNGKKIYEGDIVSIPNDKYQPDNGEAPLVLVDVRFANGCFVVEGGVFPMDEPLLGYAEEAAIIGNIYENPELLEAKQNEI